jgi:hypothetical protein
VDYSVYFKRVEPESFRLLQAIREGKSLSVAIDAVFNPSTLPESKITELVQNWFRDWAEWKWFARRSS